MLSNDPTYPLFPILAFLGSVLALLPLPFTLQAWNVGACALAGWAATACLLSFIDSVVWAGNVVNAVPGWCDIASKLLLGASIGIPASSLCISHRLWKVTSTKALPETRRDALRVIAFDLGLSTGIPLLVMILHVIVQDHRFTILEDLGCHAAIYNTLPAYFLVLNWPLGLCAASLIYAVLCLRVSYIHRLQFDHMLAQMGSMRTGLCLRLVLLALFTNFATITTASLRIAALAHSSALEPWVSWPHAHSQGGQITRVLAADWRASSVNSAAIETERWLPVLCALAFFALFGLAGEASYQERCLHVLRKVFRRSTAPTFKLPHPQWKKDHWNVEKPVSDSYIGSLPVYVAGGGDSDDPFASTRKDPFAPADLSASRSKSLDLCRSRSLNSQHVDDLTRSSSWSAPPGLGQDSAESIPALPVHIIPPSPQRTSTVTAGASAPDDSRLPHRLPDRSILASPSEASLPSVHLHARHTPQGSVTSLASCASLATSLSSRDVIYISDAYVTDPNHAYYAYQGYYTSPYDASADPPSPPPFSNLAPAAPDAEAAAKRAPTPLPMLFARRAQSPSPVRVTVQTEREVQGA
ncbi:pheromone A receptor-domain-containing protein [Schizophyllum amplum]|uniref:Pheromone A receptor-domain-containing protein n=1 Tax=Schizophyllum amplum TaxID=97359 RepID=A0A550C0M1_9AGAR|nr:pheromone A receptor-domain-containing protein [Auriculariopsis ampla]